MIQIRTFVPYSLRDLEASIKGVATEIHDRQVIMGKMRSFVNGKPGTHYKRSTMADKGYKVDREIKHLKVIKSELVYLYELSQWVNSTSNTTKD